jgi:serine/threonine protein kinase
VLQPLGRKCSGRRRAAATRPNIFGPPFGPARVRVYTKSVEAGRRIGKYVLDERIAVGGMAEVWAAHAEGLRGFVKPVALKFILESFSGDPELERLFVNEARIAARLQHANLVAVFDFDKVDPDQERGLAGRYYIAMERVEGKDLRHLSDAARQAGTVIPLGVALYVAGEVLKALRYVHERRDARGALGLVHRDVSPHNVLVGFTGEVKLSDFGIAKAREHSARNTEPGSLRGKIAYASPEQLGGAVVDHRTDQFAAGVTIWELLSGRRLFDGRSDLEIIGKVARCEIPPLGDGTGVPIATGVDAVVRRMLAASPQDRFPTTAAALSAVLALPGYSPDGAALGELVRALSRAAPLASQTLPLQGAPVGTPPVADTRTMHEGVVEPAGGDVKTPTRRAKRTTEALARSPVAAATSASEGTTADVRGPGRRVKTWGALGIALAIVGAVVARQQLVGADAPARAVVGAPVAAPTPAPVAAPAPAVAPEPVVAPASPSPPVAPAEASEHKPFEHDPAAHHHATHHRHAASAPDAPLVAPTPATVVKPPANGAPIIE